MVRSRTLFFPTLLSLWTSIVKANVIPFFTIISLLLFNNFYAKLMSKLSQCDQIGPFIGLWATFQSLWQQLICPNLPHSWSIFVKVSKSFIFLVKSFLATFIDILSGRTDCQSYIMYLGYLLGFELVTWASSRNQKTTAPTHHNLFPMTGFELWIHNWMIPV